MFNNIKNSLSYAHTKNFFLKLYAKKYGNQCCTLPGGLRPICVQIQTISSSVLQLKITLQKPNVNDVKARYLRETRSRHCETILADNKKHVIVLTDQEILNLLELSEDSDITAINDFMDTKIRSLKFKSKK